MEAKEQGLERRRGSEQWDQTGEGKRSLDSGYLDITEGRADRTS